MPRYTDVWVLAALLALAVGSGCAARIATESTAAARRTDCSRLIAGAVTDGRAKSVILLIGDGLGDSEITIARNYHVGAAGRLALDRLALTGSYTTYSVEEKHPALPHYVTDSAASATAWATGHKTSNGRLSTTAGSDQSLRTILEMAQEEGLRTGNVTTAELTDATPAALDAHVNSRRCQGPADMRYCPQYKKSAGGPGSIAEQTIDHHVDVLLGGGRRRFEQVIAGGPFAGRTVLDSARAQGYQIVTDAAQLAAAHPNMGMHREQPRGRLLGLFAPGNMSHEWRGQPATPFPGSGPQVCSENVRPPTEPGLAAMTRKALELLDKPEATGNWLHPRRRPGFFLQVEGASIDKSDHAADPCAQIGETVAFDAAVAVALEYARTHPETLVVVTADHAHTSQIVDTPDKSDHPPGVLSRLVTADGAVMTVSYATNLPGRSQGHTGTQVRIAAQGPQAANVVGVIDQTDLFYVMARALGLLPD